MEEQTEEEKSGGGGGNNLQWPNCSLDPRAANGQREREEEGGNQFSQTDTGWSNGGLKEEEEETTYFPLITSCSLRPNL